MNALRLYYFAAYMGNGALYPLLALALSARGLRPTQYAWLMALLPLSRLCAPPVWGALADRFFGTIRLLRINTMISALSMVVLAASESVALTVISFALWALASSSLTPLVDASTYRALASAPTRFSYVRVFGSIGFACGALVMSLGTGDRALRAPFMVAAVTYALSSVTARFLPDAAPPARPQLVHDVRMLARHRDALLLWLGSVLYYAGHGAFDAYFGPYARSIEGVTAELISSAWVVGVGSEIAVLFLVPRLLESRLRAGLLLLATSVAVVRWWLIASARSPLDLWLQQPLHGITFGVWYAAFLHENQARAPSSIRATVQGMASACMGLGMITATLVGGHVLERLGGRVLFRLGAVCAGLSLLCYVARYWLLRRSERTLASSESPS